MNFLSMAANKLGSAIQDKMQSPDSVFGRMSQQFGLSHPGVETPGTLGDPDRFAKGLGKLSTIVPEVDSAAATPGQESFARQNGFRNYNEMMLWAKQRANQTGGTVSQGSRMPTTVGGAVDQAMAWHPRNIFNNILQKWQEATGGGQ